LEAFFRGLPVLVTGATGFIGSHLVERLVALGASVRCLVRRTSRLGALPHGVELACGELAAAEGLEAAVRGVALVFHVAGVTKALRAEEFYRGNARATENLLRALGEDCRRLVHVSSLAAVGPSPDRRPLSEDAPPRPITYYGRSKLEAERAVLASPLAGRAVIVRPPVVYGPRDTDVLEVFRLIARGWMPSVGDADAAFSVIYVADLVDGLLAAAACEQAAGRTYFMACEQTVTWRGFGEAAGRVLGRRPRTIVVPWPLASAAALVWEWAARLSGRAAIISREKIREARCRGWVCDVLRARRELGFTARTSLEDGIERTVAWYREAGWLKVARK